MLYIPAFAFERDARETQIVTLILATNFFLTQTPFKIKALQTTFTRADFWSGKS